MEAKFTPGPWRVGGPNGYVNQVSIEPSIGAAYGAGGEVAANAALIAAAPAMYAALRRLLLQTNNIEVLGEWEALDINVTLRKKIRAEVDVAISEARAVLSHATGDR